jgi:hypothetical protein
MRVVITRIAVLLAPQNIPAGVFSHIAQLLFNAQKLVVLGNPV